MGPSSDERAADSDDGLAFIGSEAACKADAMRLPLRSYV